MHPRFPGITALLLLTAGSLYETAAATFSIDQNTTFQTIEAIGTAQNPATYTNPWRYRSGPFYVDVDFDAVHFYDTVVVDGGFTGMRCQEPMTSMFQQTRGDFSISQAAREELQSQAKFQQAARQAGESFLLLWTTFTPPPWMKANNSPVASPGTWGDLYQDPTNYLLEAHYADFADHWIRVMEIARDSFGVTVDAISLQNEPLFNEPYVSCNYSKGPGCGWNGVCYNAMFRVAAPRIRAAFPAVKFAASEDLNRITVESSLRNDAISNPLVNAWATHNDFVQSFVYPNDRPVWNTEPHSMGFLDEARMCMANLAAGATVWFTGANGGRTNGSCDTVGTNSTECLQNGVYSAIKMFARYVRPGTRRILATGGSSGTHSAIAFHDSRNQCLSIILINATAASEPVTLNVSGAFQPALLDAYYSTAAEDEIPAGQVALNGTYTMPPYSVSALVAGSYRSTGTAWYERAAAAAHTARSGTATVRALHRLDGRRVHAARGPNAPGLYCSGNVVPGAGARLLVVAPHR